MVLPSKIDETFYRGEGTELSVAEQELVDLLQEGLDDLDRGDGRDADEALAEICSELGL
jgi:hypothetical protein